MKQYGFNSLQWKGIQSVLVSPIRINNTFTNIVYYYSILTSSSSYY